MRRLSELFQWPQPAQSFIAVGAMPVQRALCLVADDQRPTSENPQSRNLGKVSDAVPASEKSLLERLFHSVPINRRPYYDQPCPHR